jgi:hypothetical protein
LAIIKIRLQKKKQKEDKNYVKLKTRNMQIIVPTLIVLAILVALIVMVQTKWVRIESLWFVFPFSGIRISTLFTAIACFALVLFLQRENTLKSIYYALLAVIFSLGLFEMVWYYTAAAFWGMEFGDFSVCCAFWLGSSWHSRSVSKAPVKIFDFFLRSFCDFDGDMDCNRI